MDFLLNVAALFLCLVCIGWLLDRLRLPKSCGLRLPPGPKGYPIIGNVFDLPTHKPWLTFDRMFKEYGDMVYLNVFGQNFLILGSQRVTNDLLEKRSKNYSDRIRSPMLLDLMEWSYSLGLLPYGPSWRDRRRTFHNIFHQNVVKNYLPVQLRTVRTFIRNVAESPEEFSEWIRFSTSSSIMEIIYGMQIEPGDRYVELAEESLDGAIEAVVPGKFWVDMLPVMKHIPHWFPGAGWKRKAMHWRDLNRAVRLEPFNLVRDQMNEGIAAPSACRTLIRKLPNPISPDRIVKENVAIDTCAVALLSEPQTLNFGTAKDDDIAAAETSYSSTRVFFMVMVLYPEAQKKGQAELDRVLGGRLPEPDDISSLPYINAIVKETLRWQPVAPFAIPHAATDADEYNGYYIPKGTTVIGNAWTLLHDPEVYKEPDEFIPDRFLKDGKLDDSVRDPSTAVFGFGRRICPGRYFALNALFLLIAHTLSVFDIKPALDEDGNEVELKADFTGGFVSHPVPFRCRIEPRSKAAIDLIRNSNATE